MNDLIRIDIWHIYVMSIHDICKNSENMDAKLVPSQSIFNYQNVWSSFPLVVKLILKGTCCHFKFVAHTHILKIISICCNWSCNCKVKVFGGFGMFNGTKTWLVHSHPIIRCIL